MRPSHSWPWVLGAAVAGVVVGLVLGRTGQTAAGRIEPPASPSRAARVPTSSVAAPPAGAEVAPSSPVSRDLRPPAAPKGARPTAAEPINNESATAAAPSPDEWEKIPIDRAFGESLGSFETRKTFANGMRGLDAFLPCVRAWKAPPNLDKVEIETELRLRSEEGVLVVEDRVILEGNVSDAALEDCVVSGSRGRRIPVPGIEPGRRYRIKWGGVAALH